MSGIEESLLVYGIPSSHHHCFLHTYDWADRPNQKKAVEEFQEGVERYWLEGGAPPHLLLYGSPGTGKTHLGVGFYRWAVFRKDAASVLWLHMPKLCDEVKHTFNQAEPEDPFEPLDDARNFVVVDDLFGRSLSPWEMDNVVFRVIDTVHQQATPLVVTMNQTVDELAELLNPHEVSRLMDGVTILEFVGEDRRL